MSPFLRSNYTIRFSDCDPFGHLNNARYVDYFLNAREDHLKTHYDLDLAAFYRKGLGWVVMQHEIVYLRPANMNEVVCIQTALLDAGPDHLLLESVMFDEKIKQVKAVMQTRFVPVSLSTGKRESHSAEFMEFLVDKPIPGLEMIPSLSERSVYWQNEVKNLQTV